MENDTSRILIETVVKKTLREIKDSPERSIRNLIDMALTFSYGRFQRSFFEIAQTMLKNGRSPYYALVQDIVAHVKEQKILRFGMNLGYNSCTIGAAKIRELEEREGCQIPWTVFLKLQAQRFPSCEESYQSTLTQGENLGIYAWMLFPDQQPQLFLPLIQQHPDSAFVLFCGEKDITASFLNQAAELDNLMLAVYLDDSAQKVCSRLREHELLYSVYWIYSEADEETIRSGRLFHQAEQLHPVFTALLPAPSCSPSFRESIHHSIKDARDQQLFQTIAWDLDGDGRLVSKIISQQAYVAAFDSNGSLLASQRKLAEPPFNLLNNDLLSIFRQAFPKKQLAEVKA